MLANVSSYNNLMGFQNYFAFFTLNIIDNLVGLYGKELKLNEDKIIKLNK